MSATTAAATSAAAAAAPATAITADEVVYVAGRVAAALDASATDAVEAQKALIELLVSQQSR